MIFKRSIVIKINPQAVNINRQIKQIKALLGKQDNKTPHSQHDSCSLVHTQAHMWQHRERAEEKECKKPANTKWAASKWTNLQLYFRKSNKSPWKLCDFVSYVCWCGCCWVLMLASTPVECIRFVDTVCIQYCIYIYTEYITLEQKKPKQQNKKNERREMCFPFCCLHIF